MKTGICAQCRLDGARVPTVCAGEADVMFVGSYPVTGEKTHFTGRQVAFFRALVSQTANQCGLVKPVWAYAYACQCTPEFDEKLHKFDITADDIRLCATHLKEDIDRSRPHVLVALGADALRALDVKGNASGLRGSVEHFTAANGTRIPIICTYHLARVSANPGLFMTLKRDIAKACRMARAIRCGDMVAESNMEVCATTDPEEIKRQLRECISYVSGLYGTASESVRESGKKVMVAVDTETTSLMPYRSTDRVIAVSLAWKPNFGLAFPLQHKAAPFSDDDYREICGLLQEALSNPGAGLTFANGKFDLQWLRHHYGFKMNDVSYDVMLAEHILDEDKKGEYSLKDITKDRFPEMGRYETEQREHQQKAWGAKDEKVRELTEQWKAGLAESKLAWWIDRPEAERIKLLATWQESGYITLEDVPALAKVKYIKRNGEMVIPKKYQDSVVKLMKSVPLSACSGLELPKLDIPEELKEHTFEDVDIDVLLRYAAIDAMTTYMCAIDQKKDFKLDDQQTAEAELRAAKVLGRKPGTVRLATKSISWPYKNIVIPLLDVLAGMEYGGVAFDRDKCREYSQVLVDKIAETEESLFTEVGYKFNLSSSSPDLRRILFEEKGLPILKRTDSGEPATDADTLKELSDSYDVPFLNKLLVHRRLTKCKATYIDNWLKVSELDGHIHCSFLQNGTATGRLSSSNPNLQNVPFQLKEANLNLKSLFLPDSPDYEIYDLDISNAEMRVLTAYSKDAALIDAFNSGKDLHCLTAAAISQYSYDDIKAHKDDKTTDQYVKRQLAKKVNFGTIYCMGAQTLQAKIWSDLRIQTTEEECQKYLDDFFTGYPGVERYIEDTKAFVRIHGFTYTYLGRKRRFPIAQYSGAHASRVARQAVNARIQSTSSDLVCLNIIDLNKFVRSLGGRILLTVHDSIVFQLPKGVTGVKSELDKIIMHGTADRAPWLPVQWKYDVDKGPNYGDCHTAVA